MTDTTTTARTENSPLLPLARTNSDNKSNSTSTTTMQPTFTASSRSLDNYDDDEFLELKKFVHNDPTITKKFIDPGPEEFQHQLLGSSKLLMEKIHKEKWHKKTHHRYRGGSNSNSDNGNGNNDHNNQLRCLEEVDEDMLDTTSKTDLTQTTEESISSSDEEQQQGKGKGGPPRTVAARGRVPRKHRFTEDALMEQMNRMYKETTKKKDEGVTTEALKKIKTNFFEDAKSLAEGTIPQSVVVATVIGIVCGIACYLYYTVLFKSLDFFWKTLPQKVMVENENWDEHYYWCWIPLMGFSMSTLVGLTVIYIGEPGDLPCTISRVHSEAYIPMSYVTPMAFASLFSILAGGSLGPEAPLVKICGALGGWISRKIFRQTSSNVVRKHTFMGMAGALAAFFGVPLGGSLFGLEVCSRFGIEYFEHLVESIFCGEICLMVFRSLSGLPIKPIWNLTSAEHPRIVECMPMDIMVGAFIGLYGAILAYFFATFHWRNMAFFGRMNLLDNENAVYRGWLASIFIVLLMLLVPHTGFWGEAEIEVVATMGPASSLPNMFPTAGLIGFEMDTPFKAFIVGICKLIAISFTVAGGLRGGFIFPLMCSGVAFGRVLYHFMPDNTTVPLQVVVLCTAAAINVSITRTSLATTLILAFLPGEPMAIPPILMSSLCALFATSYMPFIKSQISRSDLDHSLFHEEHHIADDDSVIDSDSDED